MPDPDNTDSLVPHLAAYPTENDYVNTRVYDMNANEDKDENSDCSSDLYSHATVVVLGQHCYIIYSSVRHAEVNTFARELGRMKSVPIVDAAIVYNCMYSTNMYLLIVRNALYIQSMTHNLLPMDMLQGVVQANLYYPARTISH